MYGRGCRTCLLFARKVHLLRIVYRKKKKGKKQQHYGTNDPKSMQGMSPVLCVVVSRRVLFKHASLVPAVRTDKNGGGEEKSVRTQKPTNQTKRKENEKYTCAHKHYAHRA